jgi:hypothetical protein
MMDADRQGETKTNRGHTREKGYRERGKRPRKQ